jgi:hypothetical protein
MATEPQNNDRIFTLITILFISTFSLFIGVIFAFYNSISYSLTIACFALSFILFIGLGIILFAYYVETITPKISGYYRENTVKVNYCVLALLVVLVLAICFTQMTWDNFKATFFGTVLATILFVAIDYYKDHRKKNG